MVDGFALGAGSTAAAARITAAALNASLEEWTVSIILTPCSCSVFFNTLHLGIADVARGTHTHHRAELCQVHHAAHGSLSTRAHVGTQSRTLSVDTALFFGTLCVSEALRCEWECAPLVRVSHQGWCTHTGVVLWQAGNTPRALRGK